MPKIDTVGAKYYGPLKWLDLIGSGLFWLTSAASIGTLLVDRGAHASVSDALQIVFILGVVLYFTQGQVQRLYFFPRAEDQRRHQLLSDSYRVNLTHEVTAGYYNNSETAPLRRLASSVMESAFFTHEIAGIMLVGQRWRSMVYSFVYSIAVYNRSTDLAFIAIAAQAIFGEEILSRWLRLEWLSHRSAKVFDDLNRLFDDRLPFSRPATQAHAIDSFSFYESTKATAAVLLSSRVFNRENDRLSGEWELIRQRLGI
ncbi:MAG TPA: hypothetical protein VGN79_03255 [Devosia sp.]|jgi:hypothetical protein|nr:hypothetical protein [Devosia sp.]